MPRNPTKSSMAHRSPSSRSSSRSTYSRGNRCRPTRTSRGRRSKSLKTARPRVPSRLLLHRRGPRRCRRASRLGHDHRGHQRSCCRGPRRRRERARRSFGFASWRGRRRRLSLRSRLWARRSRLERMLAYGSMHIEIDREGRELGTSRQSKTKAQQTAVTKPHWRTDLDRLGNHPLPRQK
jgi:hypothetical protein